MISKKLSNLPFISKEILLIASLITTRSNGLPKESSLTETGIVKLSLLKLFSESLM